MPHVLVVEDDDEIRESFVEALEEMGHPARGVMNGRKALEVLRSAPLPCLIVLDLMMPVMDGRAFREAQLADAAIAGVPVLVVSAYRDVQSTAEAMRAQEWLSKPVKLDDLLQAVKRHCAD